ncbi:MAG: amidohydrolase family protein [Planctomycetota bacterium]
MSGRRLSRGGALLLLLAAASAPALAQDLALEAGHVVVRADHEPLRGATILIRGGSVAAIGTKLEVPAGVPRVALPDAWVIPGLVDARTTLGLRGDLDEAARPLEPDVDLASRVDPRHRDFAALRAAGVTTALLSPGDKALFAGSGVLLKTAGKVLEPRVAKLSLMPAAYGREHPPTSRSGALALLRGALERAHGGEGAAPGLVAFARGDVVGLVAVPGARDLEDLLQLRQRYGLRVVIHLEGLAREAELSDLDLNGVFVALGPAGAESTPQSRRQAAWLAKRGARVLFVSGYPQGPAEGALLAAHHAVSGGLSPREALAGLTSTAAEALDLGERIGTLEAGREADLCVLSGPPLDLSTRVLEVYAAGERVWRRARPEGAAE